jgi:transcriptional regulator with XRE-family HTH domain
MKVHERVRLIRVHRGIQQKFVAQKLGLSVSHYNKIELGNRPLRADLIPPLADILDVKPCDFFSQNLDVPSKT